MQSECARPDDQPFPSIHDVKKDQSLFSVQARRHRVAAMAGNVDLGDGVRPILAVVDRAQTRAKRIGLVVLDG